MRHSTSALTIAAILAVTPAVAQQSQTPPNQPMGTVPSNAQNGAAGAGATEATTTNQPGSGGANVTVESTGEAKVIVTETPAPAMTPAAGQEPVAPEATDAGAAGGVQVGAPGVEAVEKQAVEGAETAPAAGTEMQPAQGVVVETQPVVVETQPVVVETTEAEVPEGTPVAGQMFEQSATSYLASSLIGARVQSVDGEDVGEVNDLVVGEGGMIEGVVIGVGGFLGIGEKDVAVTFSEIQTRLEENGGLTFVLDTTEEAMDAAPEFRTQDDIRAERDAVVVPADPTAPPAMTPANPGMAPATPMTPGQPAAPAQ